MGGWAFASKYPPVKKTQGFCSVPDPEDHLCGSVLCVQISAAEPSKGPRKLDIRILGKRQQRMGKTHSMVFYKGHTHWKMVSLRMKSIGPGQGACRAGLCCSTSTVRLFPLLRIRRPSLGEKEPQCPNSFPAYPKAIPTMGAGFPQERASQGATTL